MVKTPPFQCRGFPCGSAGKESACNMGLQRDMTEQLSLSFPMQEVRVPSLVGKLKFHML